MSKVALLGHGVVGSGVVEILKAQENSIEKKAGENISLKYIVDIRKFDDLDYRDLFVTDFAIVENDSEVDVIVECIGGATIAYDYVKRSLRAKKNVVTSNKELVAKHGAELLVLAKENDVNFLFEASVGGGIPIIAPMHQCLAANEINLVAGILNGTTNFILSKMINEQMSFDDALSQAQQLGYAESDPSADVDGIDTCRKICILASLAYGNHVYPQYVAAKGIRNIKLDDVAFAEDYNSAIKLIGYAKLQQNGKVNIEVSPMLVKKESQLAHVGDVYNAILVCGDSIGKAVFYGRGAGKLPTASAVVADIIDCVKAKSTILSLFWNDCKEDITSDIKSEKFDYYVRFNGSEKANQISSLDNAKMLLIKNQPSNEFAAVIKNVSEYEIEAMFDTQNEALWLKVFNEE